MAALVGLVLLTAIWSYSWIVMKQVMLYAGAFEFTALRCLCGSLVLLLVLALRGRRYLKPTPFRYTLAIALFQTVVTSTYLFTEPETRLAIVEPSEIIASAVTAIDAVARAHGHPGQPHVRRSQAVGMVDGDDQATGHGSGKGDHAGPDGRDGASSGRVVLDPPVAGQPRFRESDH